MFGCVFDAAQRDVVHDVSGGAYYEEIAEPLIKHDLGRGARIRAAENDREGMLAILEIRPARGALMRMRKIAGNEASVAGFEPGERRVGLEGGTLISGECAER